MAIKRSSPSSLINKSKKSTNPTAFQQRVYALCKSIPAGKVTTYKAMADVLHSHSRAVGQALRRNPYAPVVPCHRVIASTLYIGGFSGTWGSHEKNDSPVHKKLDLLKKEGVRFSKDDGQLLNVDEALLLAEDLKKLV